MSLSLLRKVLAPLPSNRINIEHIKKHRWMLRVHSSGKYTRFVILLFPFQLSAPCMKEKQVLEDIKELNAPGQVLRDSELIFWTNPGCEYLSRCLAEASSSTWLWSVSVLWYPSLSWVEFIKLDYQSTAADSINDGAVERHLIIAHSRLLGHRLIHLHLAHLPDLCPLFGNLAVWRILVHKA